MANFHTFSIGKLTCTSLLDFARERTPRQTFPRIDPIQLEKEIEAGDYGIEIDTPMPLHGVALLIDDGKQKILIDSGLPTAGGGQLVASLAEAGHSPDDIDILIITHGDGDHIGGLSNYNRARIVMPATSYKLWTTDTDGMVEEFIKLFRGQVSEEDLAAQAMGRRAYLDVLASLQAAGRVTLVDPGEEVVEGISLLPAPGHRRDHFAVEVRSGEATLIHIADAFRHPIQLKRHDFYCLFDSYPEQLAASMVMLLQKAAADDSLVFGAHFPFPSIIRIGNSDAGFQWVPSM